MIVRSIARRPRLSEMTGQEITETIAARFAVVGGHKCALCRTPGMPYSGSMGTEPWLCNGCKWNMLYAGGQSGLHRLEVAYVDAIDLAAAQRTERFRRMGARR